MCTRDLPVTDFTTLSVKIRNITWRLMRIVFVNCAKIRVTDTIWRTAPKERNPSSSTPPKRGNKLWCEATKFSVDRDPMVQGGQVKFGGNSIGTVPIIQNCGGASLLYKVGWASRLQPTWNLGNTSHLCNIILYIVVYVMCRALFETINTNFQSKPAPFLAWLFWIGNWIHTGSVLTSRSSVLPLLCVMCLFYFAN